MAFIEIVAPDAARDETAAAYRYMQEVGGSGLVAKIVQMFSLRPGSMRRMIRTWELIMWFGDAARQDRELAAAAVSRFNNCHY